MTYGQVVSLLCRKSGTYLFKLMHLHPAPRPGRYLGGSGLGCFATAQESYVVHWPIGHTVEMTAFHRKALVLSLPSNTSAVKLSACKWSTMSWNVQFAASLPPSTLCVYGPVSWQVFKMKCLLVADPAVRASNQPSL